ncbi:hypothetical protein G7Y79_00002g007220 [Physcia stellaris]|nr:hypothetical protein G7Y79_00002g007220 [Physcia stellaris]
MKPWSPALAITLTLLPFAAHSALLPASSAPSQPQLNLTAHGSIDLHVPGTKTTLTFSEYGALLSQTELDLCVIEGLAHAMATVMSLKRDSVLPRSKFTQKYGEVEISVQDSGQFALRLTYGTVANMLRGVALFMSLYGWYEVVVGVMDDGMGQIGVGRVRRAGRGAGRGWSEVGRVLGWVRRMGGDSVALGLSTRVYKRKWINTTQDQDFQSSRYHI